MKKFIYLFAVMVSMLFVGCNKYDDEIAAIENRLDKIEGSKITSIEQQISNINASVNDLKNVDAELQKLVDGLRTELAKLQKQLEEDTTLDAATKKALVDEIANIKVLIAELQKKDAELDQKIAGLQSYVNSGITATEDWVSATFATLAQYEGVQTEIAAVKALIRHHETDVTAGYTAAIEEKISAIETSMKSWVNEELQKVYEEIADLEAQLSGLTAGGVSDQELADAIAEQQAALEQAKSELADAYQQAIQDAVANGGIISNTILSIVETVQNALLEQINNIADRVDALESKLEDIVGRIQSLTFIPQYSDGKVKMDYESRETVLDFIVSPAELLQNLNDAFSVNKGIIKAYVRYTSDPVTRVVSAAYLQTVSEMQVRNDGLFTLTVSGTNLDEKFWSGDVEAVIYIQISIDSSEFVSEAIPMVAHGYVNNKKNDISDFENGDDYTGEASE